MERQKSVKILAGNSHSTARWGWLGILSFIESFLPCCLLCLAALLGNQDSSQRRAATECCGNWSMEGLAYPPPENFPVDILTSVPPSIPFRKNSFAAMGAACDIAYSKVSMGVWSKVQADTRLTGNANGNRTGGSTLITGGGPAVITVDARPASPMPNLALLIYRFLKVVKKKAHREREE
jgi:hypothetical protein